MAKIGTYTKLSEVKAIEIEVSMVEKIIFNTILDGGSDLNIISFQIMKKLGMNITSPSSFVIKMTNQSLSISIG